MAAQQWHTADRRLLVTVVEAPLCIHRAAGADRAKYGEQAAGGGGLSRKQPRPAYQDGFNPQNHRAVPDISALADIVPGWPDVINAKLQTVGGWFYQAAKSQPASFFDITKGSNDLSGVGCCQAAVGYDLASGLGVPNWAVLPGSLPPPG